MVTFWPVKQRYIEAIPGTKSNENTKSDEIELHTLNELKIPRKRSCSGNRKSFPRSQISHR